MQWNINNNKMKKKTFKDEFKILCGKYPEVSSLCISDDKTTLTVDASNTTTYGMLGFIKYAELRVIERISKQNNGT